MSSSCGRLLGKLIGIAAIGLGFWGSAAIGVALGFYGIGALAVGGSVIAAGILALCAVSAGVYYLAKGCVVGYRSIRDRYHAYTASRNVQHAQQAQSVLGMNTRGIQQGLNVNARSVNDAPIPEVPSAPVMYPPLYQPPPNNYQQYVGLYNDPAYYVPPRVYGQN